MRLTDFALLVLPSAIRAAQIPFQSLPATETFATDSAWNDLDTQPNLNATSHLIFDTVNSLLQHWPNTRYRNGHNIVPGTIPVGTLLYHGRPNSSVPSIPEWTATDPEHAYPFCGGEDGNATESGCWQLTFVATRPLKVLYFDGSSAANMRNKEAGTLDAQDLLVWGKVEPARWVAERARIDGLCAWGREFGIDGYVRMEMDFEVMICDFTAGIELVAADFLAALWARHITAPLHPGAPSPAVKSLLNFETVRAGSWHNRYPGETRIALDLSRLISFYDTSLVPSLVPHRAGLERWDHRLQSISDADLAAVTKRLRAALAPAEASAHGSGVDWQTLYRVVVDRYADRLELLEYLLNTTTAENLAARAPTIQAQLRVMLTPYILYTARPTRGDTADDDAWAAPVWRGCATRHTAHIHASRELNGRLTAGEGLLLRAVDETSREICRVVVRMWASGVRAGLDALIPLEDDADLSDAATTSRVVEGWRAEARALMAWLDWSVWIKCRPACGVEEMCYLPTWPFFFNGVFNGDRQHGPDADPEDEGEEEAWKRPQPRCIRMFAPYSTL
ncbi:hypothetical protein DFH09DRAFT_1039894 [Mycena vulgaris]|nr:hypothetical protein DFH09DRAFT_1039894 [Mycena vulgaris]